MLQENCKTWHTCHVWILMSMLCRTHDAQSDHGCSVVIDWVCSVALYTFTFMQTFKSTCIESIWTHIHTQCNVWIENICLWGNFFKSCVRQSSVGSAKLTCFWYKAPKWPIILSYCMWCWWKIWSLDWTGGKKPQRGKEQDRLEHGIWRIKGLLIKLMDIVENASTARLLGIPDSLNTTLPSLCILDKNLIKLL